ncbi:DEAD/DEAH box helicase [Allokutzneria multivorans]|uniref:DEAD/DEAH box helicase n=1 Tax=Allokutzneria multivorans TaxID=1142134 RepID=UPI0031E79C50
MRGRTEGRRETAGGAAHRRPRGRDLLEQVVAGTGPEEDPLTHVATVAARSAVFADWPDWAPGALVDALREDGVRRPWRHQVDAAELARAGRNVVVATGTASGKSLAYQLPVLAALTEDERARALYLAPTKALGADQLRSVNGFGLAGIRAASFDGDTPRVERDWVRAHSRWIFTNPDMLHRGILPAHARWSGFFRRLTHVVIDECHAYRGVFGSHVALLLRRLRRIARRYGSDPVFVLASATAASPAESASLLTGAECHAVTEDGSPSGGRTIALWEPPLLEDLTGENGAPLRRSAGAEAARVLADLVLQGARTLAFVRSRRGVELASLGARRALADVDPELARFVDSYRGGYLPEERRALERALLDGRLLGLATTSALELGVDISGLDAVLVAGWPGTLSSFWQQAGRAGRDGDEALVIFIARDDPLDTYLVHHPAALLSRPVEATVLDPANPYVLAPQLVCAAAELPLTEDCVAGFGPAARPVLDGLVADGVLRRRPTGWFWTDRESPHATVDIRGSGGEQIAVVEGESGRLLGTVDPDSACATVHPGAVYLHRGESYVVDELDLDGGLALVHAEDPEWTTSPRTVVDISVVRTEEERRYSGGVSVCLGEVEVTSEVVGFLRKLPSGRVLDQVPLDLPAQTLTTRAVWYTLSEELLRGSAPGGAGLEPARTPGALHAAEHAAIGLLPLFATCDRWDIGGVSTASHADTGEATVFVHDGHPGGAGFADRGHAAIVPWLAATREAIVSCECPAGCPSCVQSPKCGNGNEPLDKAGAVAVLDAVLAVVGSSRVERADRSPSSAPR